MKLKHQIKINVSDGLGDKSKTVLKGGQCVVRSSKLSKFLGSRVGILVLVPEESAISSVEVSRAPSGGVA